MLKAAVLMALVAVSCWLSITLTRQPGSLSTLWIASGIVCGLLLTSPRPQWPVLLAVALAANLGARFLHGDAWYSVLGLGGASTLEAWLVAALIARRVADVNDPAQVRRIFVVATLSTLVACTLSAALAAWLVAQFRALAFGPAFLLWFAAHTLGMVIFATLVVIVRGQGRRLIGRRGRRRQLALAVALTAAVAVAVFAQSRYPLIFLVHVPLLWLVFRHGFRGVVFGTTAVALIATVATVLGSGPFVAAGGGPVEHALLLQLFVAATCVVSMPVAIGITERTLLTRQLRESEQRYRILADYSHDLVVRIAPDGRRLYVSPSVTELLGWRVDELADPRWDLVHPDDAATLQRSLQTVFESGGATAITYRMRHRQGHYVWLEAHACLVPGTETGGRPEIVYAGRDVSRRIEAERRLRAIADNMPSIIAQLDRSERFVFANAYASRLLGLPLDSIVGHGMREVLGAEMHDEVKPHIDAALRGETAVFEIERHFHGQHGYFQATYIPEIDADGGAGGFYVLISDISQLKRAENELTLLARFDSLTGLANRFHFNERVDLALAHRQRHDQPLTLMYLDVDRFKDINDRFGHATGDGVLREFGMRLKDCVRQTDLVARIGGDEFLILIDDIDVPATAEIIARKVLATIRQSRLLDEFGTHVTTSIGVAFCSARDVSREELLHLADRALYESKAAGRDTYRMIMRGENPAGT